MSSHGREQTEDASSLVTLNTFVKLPHLIFLICGMGRVVAASGDDVDINENSVELRFLFPCHLLFRWRIRLRQ